MFAHLSLSVVKHGSQQGTGYEKCTQKKFLAWLEDKSFSSYLPQAGEKINHFQVLPPPHTNTTFLESYARDELSKGSIPAASMTKVALGTMGKVRGRKKNDPSYNAKKS